VYKGKKENKPVFSPGQTTKGLPPRQWRDAPGTKRKSRIGPLENLLEWARGGEKVARAKSPCYDQQKRHRAVNGDLGGGGS